MITINAGGVGIDQGDVVLFSDFVNDGLMWSGAGDREIRTFIKFSGAFSQPPVVHVGMSMWDVSVEANQRLDLTTDEVTTTGFVAVFKTWSDSRVARLRVNWMAIGEIADTDVWDV